MQSELRNLARNTLRIAGQRQSGKNLIRVFEFALRSLYNERNWNFESNGERWLLERFIKLNARCLEKLHFIDVGANRGEWTMEVKRLLLTSGRGGRISAFEPNPLVFPELKKFCISNSLVTIEAFNAAIGSTGGTHDLHVPQDHSMSSFQLRAGLQSVTSIKVEVFDSADVRRAIGKGDPSFIKIDTEGSEVDVIRTLLDLIQLNRPLIQFEYGKTFVSSRTTLHDVYEMLEPLGFRIGRLFPTAVRFADYDINSEEHFRFGNYVAVPLENDICAGLT